MEYALRVQITCTFCIDDNKYFSQLYIATCDLWGPWERRDCVYELSMDARHLSLYTQPKND